MLYLKVENPGFSPIDALLLYGVSSSRGDTNLLGQFGTGQKLGITQCLKSGHSPVVFSNLLKVEYYTKPKEVKGTVYNQVCYKISGKDENGKAVRRDECSSSVTEHGSLDWNLEMALREFVSNAIDGSVETTGNYKGASVEVVADNKVRAKAGYTRIFVPLTPEVQSFYNTLAERFLHFAADSSLLNQVVLEKRPSDNLLPNAPKGPRIYRKGVFVRQADDYEDPSLFDYNFGDDLEIDESRNLDNYRIKSAMGRALAAAPVDKLAKLFKSLGESQPYYEFHVDTYSLQHPWNISEIEKERRNLNWRSALQSVYGERAILVDKSYTFLSQAIQRKGFTPVPTEFTALIRASAEYGLTKSCDVLDSQEQAGREVCEATPAVLACLDDVWQYLDLLELTNGKTKPQASCFKAIVSGETIVFGYYKDNTVYINTDFADAQTDALWETVLEEVGHYITGATDLSRDFQSYFMKAVAKSRKLLG